MPPRSAGSLVLPPPPGGSDPSAYNSILHQPPPPMNQQYTTMSTTGRNEEQQQVEQEGAPDEISPLLLKRYSSIPSFIKTPSTFHNDLMELAPGSIPHSVLVAITIGVICGIAAFLYYAGLEWALKYLWKTLPEQVFGSSGQYKVLWIPIIGLIAAICVGASVRILGEPGDLPYTIKCVHESAFVSMDHVLPMVIASQFSILGAGSLGPEAPLVAICAALGGWVSQSLYGTTDRNLIRKHTLMGMSGALAAFFGCPLGGSLFALEVNSRFGIEYFEHTVEAIFCGEVCLAVFRTLARLPIEPIWKLADMPLPSADPRHIICGAVLGLLGAAIAAVFTKFHFYVMGKFRSNGLLQDENAIQRALWGALVVLGIGVLMPATLFWGEYEFQTVATLAPASSLPHVWPTSGLFGFEMNSFGTAMLVGIGKLIAISFTVSGGYRGGFIFPLFVSGAAFGRAVHFLCPFIPVQLSVLCMAAALNVAVTRTSISTTLILAFLAGEQNAISAILAASLTSLFATAYMPFIKTQVARSDIECSIFMLDEDNDTAATDPLTPFPLTKKSSGTTTIIV